jgi:glycerol-3-phosphate acyltransferase PlsY
VSLALLALAYLLGSIPTSFVIGKYFHGIDLRQHGSGNLGATNAFRVLGPKWAVPVMLGDIAKGFVPVALFAGWSGGAFGWTLAFGAAAILGHMFSVWVGFRGGKGMATSAGVFLGLAPWAVLICLLVWCGLTFATGYVSVASIGAAILLPPLVALTPHSGGEGLSWFSVALAAVVIWAHRANIGRLVRGEENRFWRGRPGGSDEESRAANGGASRGDGAAEGAGPGS